MSTHEKRDLMGSASNPATTSTLRWFAYGHLPIGLPRDVSKEFAEIASRIVGRLVDDPQTTAALNALLAAKDAAVRAAIITSMSTSTIDKPTPIGDRRLTARRRQLLALLADGLSTRQAATAMGVSEATVKTTIATIVEKLGVRNRTHAVVIAIRDGILD